MLNQKPTTTSSLLLVVSVLISSCCWTAHGFSTRPPTPVTRSITSNDTIVSTRRRRRLRQDYLADPFQQAAATRTSHTPALLLLASTEETADSSTSSTNDNNNNNPPALPTPPGPTVVLDHGVHDHIYREAIVRTVGWVAAAGIFGGVLWTTLGPETGEEFFAGYLVEQSLSVDNLFVFLLLFEFFGVPLALQNRVLNWGIYGAIVMRAVMIGLGAAALEKFHAILLVFAAILVYSSAKVLVPGGQDEDEDVSQNAIVRFVESLIDASDKYDGDRFFTIVDGVRKATPLFICLVAVEISDVVFAVDSIPAVFGVTENPLVVFSSNMFAIMGLRSLYTILSKAATDLKYLEPAVAVVLGFIGSKMIAEYFGIHIPTEESLAVVMTCLGGGVGLSVWEKQKELEDEEA